MSPSPGSSPGTGPSSGPGSSPGTGSSSGPGSSPGTGKSSGPGTSSGTGALPVADPTSFNVRSYGAVGDGAADDTSAIQSTINAAQAVGGIVFFPPGSYKISAPLKISGRVQILGCGYQGDGGQVYLGQNLSQSSGFFGSVIVCGPSTPAIVATTNLAILIEGIQITYPSKPQAGVTAILIQAASGAGNSNTGSVLRDLMINGHGIGIQLINCLDFVIDNSNLYLGWYNGITIASPNYPSYGDSVITNCTIMGNGVSSYTSHILVSSGGGLRIVDNKLNYGSDTATCAILISPNLSVAQSVEPLVIASNSIEGGACGIVFSNGNPKAQCSLVSIIGNEIWSGSNAILANTNSSGQWIFGLSIVGNLLQVNGGSGKTIMVLDSVSIGIVTGNTFTLSGGGTGTGIDLGAGSSNVSVQSNAYASGVSPVANSGQGNKIGGGSA